VVAALIAYHVRPVSATVYNSIMEANDVLDWNDRVDSGLGYQQLTMIWHSGANTKILRLRWVGPGSDYDIWNSLIDGDWDAEPGNHQDQWGLDPSDDVYAIMQADGNFVMYDSGLDPMWSTDTGGNDDAYLNVQDDTNMVIYSENEVPLWALY
jgi:hypothetical protein